MRYPLKGLMVAGLIFTILGEMKGQPLVINEMMSLNNSCIKDEDDQDSDWIEIYNTTSEVLNLAGYYLSDNDATPRRWAFPDTVIQPRQFMLIFASGKNRRVAGNQLHTNFSIKADGEPLILSHAHGVVHRMPPVNLQSNRSYGLARDGTTPLVVFYKPTPGKSNNMAPVAAGVFFSHPGGIYENSFDLTLSSDSKQCLIYYTTNGTSPNTSSYLYSQPLQLCSRLYSEANISQVPIYPPGSFNPPPPASVPKAVVIRAAAFDQQGNQLSEVISNSYFIKALSIDHHQLPILSICAEHHDLFDFHTGIFVAGIHWDAVNPDWTGNYYQRGQDWEREINLEYYTQDYSSLNHKAGLRTHGGNSRHFSQKGMRLYAREDYGTSFFGYPFFEDKPFVRYKHLVLKPFFASWSQAGIEDYVTLKIAGNLNVDRVATHPVVVYINGEYWGIYYLQEHISSSYIETNYGVEQDKADLIGNWHGMIECGDNSDFLALYDFIENNNLSIGSNYDIVKNWMDIDNFIDYQLLEMFIANEDWPSNNMKCWKERDSDSKWRWIYYDGDAALQKYRFNGFLQALDTSGERWGTDQTATLFLRKLLENEDFKSNFQNRLHELLNNHLSYSQTNSIYQEAIEEIGNEVHKQINRFSFPANYDKWFYKVLTIKEFLTKRSCVVAGQYRKTFNEALMVGNCQYEEIEVADLLLYPNPNNGNFTITFHSSETAPAYINIYNHHGQVVASFEEVILQGDNTLNIIQNHLPDGLLYVSVETENQLFGARMIKLGY